MGDAALGIPGRRVLHRKLDETMSQGNQKPRGDNACEHCVFIASLGDADYYACSHWACIHALPRGPNQLTTFSMPYRDLESHAGSHPLLGAAASATRRPFHIAYRRAVVRGLI